MIDESGEDDPAMRPLASAALLAMVALVAPLAAAAIPPCAPAGHCPMAMAAGDMAPCHQASIDADDCCLADASELAQPAVPLAAAAPPADEKLAAGAPPGERAPQPLAAGSSATPLYTLFRTLLI